MLWLDLTVLAKEGDAHPLGALPVGTLVNNLETEPGKGAQFIRAAGKILLAFIPLVSILTRGFMESVDANVQTKWWLFWLTNRPATLD